MKNLKRLLSLALTGVMLSGMMVMGASAADFTDADEIVNTEAVDTMVALNIINGKDTGAFDPEGLVTRAEMAKMIATAVNGGVAPSFGVKATPTYTDTKGHWAEQFIEYCSDMKYINGRGNGTFDPNGNVTGVEAAKMVLTALGYESRAYQLTGADWAINTNALAIRNCKPSLYENLNGVSMNMPISRDTAAQLIWNGVQNHIVEYNPNVTITGTDISYGYKVNDKVTLLKQAYDANISTGTFEGNGKSINSLKDGQIRVNVTTENGVAGSYGNKTATADLDIAYIGENVKVIWKDEKNTAPGLDAKDKVYGVFTTGETIVYNITKNDLQNAGSKDKLANIKFDDSLHAAKSSIAVVTDYGRVADTTVTPASVNDVWRTQSIDQIKFTCDPTDGKIAKAYVTTIKAGKVSGVTSTKATITGLGTITIADHDVYEDIAKGDVVTFTQFFDTDLDDAFVTVTKAEKVEGDLKGFKLDGSAYVNVVVDGETYKVNNQRLDSITDDAITAPAYTNIGDKVAVYLANNMVVALDSIEETGGKYALVTDVSSTGTPGAAINGLKVRVLLADGSEPIVNVHKDSTKDNRSGSSAAKITAASDLAVGDLIEYSSLTSDTIKIKSIAKDSNNTAGSAYVAAPEIPAQSGGVNGTLKVWDKDKKEVTYATADGTNTTAVAASDAVLFVSRDTNGTTGITAGDDFKAYNIRSLGNLKLGDNSTASDANDANDIHVYIKDGLVQAVAFVLTEKPKTAANVTLYGIVSSYVGTREIENTTYVQYKVAVNQDEPLIINVEGDEADHNSGSLLKVKEVVTFDQRSDNCYAVADFTKLVTWSGATPDVPTVAGATAIAVDKYDEGNRLLTYFTQTSRPNATSAFAGVSATQTSKTVDKDVKIIYINAGDLKDGEAVGVNSFSTDTGYANALFTTNDGLVDVIIVETSNKVNWGGSSFAQKSTVTLTNPNATIAASTGNNGAYTVALSTTTPEVGDPFTVTVTCTSVDGANAQGETVTVTYNSVDYTHTFTEAGSHSFNITAVSGQTAVTAAVAAAS